MLAKIIVAFRTVLVPNMLPDVATLEPPGTMSKPETIARWREEQAMKLAESCLLEPYLAQFEEVQLFDIKNERKVMYKLQPPEAGKLPVCVRVRNWLLKGFPEAWPHVIQSQRSFQGGAKITAPEAGQASEVVFALKAPAPEVVFLGFHTRLFLKMLGIECSLPANQPADITKLGVLPLSMWYANSDHRDIGEAVKPAEYKHLTWDIVLRARGLRERYKDWNGPMGNVTADLNLASDFAAQLGMLSEIESA